jgi:hypothetical protein
MVHTSHCTSAGRDRRGSLAGEGRRRRLPRGGHRQGGAVCRQPEWGGRRRAMLATPARIGAAGCRALAIRPLDRPRHDERTPNRSGGGLDAMAGKWGPGRTTAPRRQRRSGGTDRLDRVRTDCAAIDPTTASCWRPRTPLHPPSRPAPTVATDATQQAGWSAALRACPNPMRRGRSPARLHGWRPARPVSVLDRRNERSAAAARTAPAL